MGGVLDLMDRGKSTAPGPGGQPVPFSTLGQAIPAVIEDTVRNHNFASSGIEIQNQLRIRADSYKDATGENLLVDMVKSLPLDEQRKMRKNGLDLQTLIVQERGNLDPEILRQIDGFIFGLKTRQPSKFSNIKTFAEMQAFSRDKALQASQTAQDVLRGTTPGKRLTAQLAGGVLGSFKDPLTIATLPAGGLGWSASSSFAKRFLINAAAEGVLNVGVEAVSHPFISRWQKELGKEYGTKEFLGNAGIAFLFGATFSGLSEAAGASRSFAFRRVENQLKLIKEENAAVSIGLEARRAQVGETKAFDIDDGLHNQIVREHELAAQQQRPANFEQFGISEKQFRNAEFPDSMKELHARYIDEGAPTTWDVDPNSPKNVKKKPTVGDYDRFEKPPEIENVTEVAKIYESPEFVAKEKVDFEKIKETKKSEDIAIKDESDGTTLTYEQIDDAAKADADFLKSVETCGIGGS